MDTLDQLLQELKPSPPYRPTRPLSAEREFEQRGHDLEDLFKLRQLAARLSRRAGVKGVTEHTFEGRTKNQILNTIFECRNYLNGRA